MSISTLIDTVRQAQTIELDIPDTTPSGKFWAPHQFTPSVQLARVDQVPRDSLPRPEPPLGSVPLRLKLVRRLGECDKGYVDVYYARVVQSPNGTASSALAPPPPRLVVKIIDLSFFAPIAWPTRASVEKCVAGDYRAFTILEALQGSEVPRIGGMFGNKTLFCTVYEDAGRWVTSEEKCDAELFERFLSTIRTIHAAGVAAMPLDWTCVCISDDGEIRITDFVNAVTREHYERLAEQRPLPGGATVESLYASISRHALSKAQELFCIE